MEEQITAAAPLPYLRVSGSYREIGRQVGEEMRESIVAAIAFYAEHFVAWSGVAFAEAELLTAPRLEAARRHLPQCVEELAGMAEGAGVELAELLVHNEDWIAADLDKNVVLDIAASGGARVLAVTSVPYLPVNGINSFGVACAQNSLSATDERIGVPNVFVCRWALEAGTLEEARARLCLPARGIGSSGLLADAGGRLWSVETSGTADALTVGDAWLARTNHFVAPQMRVWEKQVSAGSQARLARAEQLAAAGVASAVEPLGLAGAVLSDHAPEGVSICGHADTSLPVMERDMTVASMLFDVTAGRLHAAAGPACAASYQTFAL
jgi:isopenicillin-N N-acyltransferase-like protein